MIRIEGDTAIARPVADPARIDFAIVQRAWQPAADGPLDDAPAPVVAPPVAGPPPGPAPRPGQQNNPRYQPALQQGRGATGAPPPQGPPR